MTALTPRALQRIAWSAVGLMILGSLVGIVVPAGLGWDFANFYDAGQKAASGHILALYDPFFEVPGRSPLAHLQFWSAPLTAFLFAPLAALPPVAALTLFKLQNALAYAAGLIVLFLEYRRLSGGSARETASFAAWFAVLALVYQPFWTIFRVGGQTTPTVFLLLVLAMVAHTRGRFGTTAGLLVAAAAIKPAFAPALVILALLTGPAMIGWAALWTGGAALVSVALLGWPVHAEFLQLLRAGAGPPLSPWYYNSAPAVLVGNRVLLEDPSGLGYRVLHWSIRLGVLASMAFVLIRARSQRWRPEARHHFHFMIAVLACLLLATVAWEHYLTAIFPLLVFLVARRSNLGRPARAVLAATFVLSLAQNVILVNLVRDRFLLDGHLELFLAGLIKSAPLWLSAVLLVRYSREVFRAYETASWPISRVTGSTAAVIPTGVPASVRGSL